MTPPLPVGGGSAKPGRRFLSRAAKLRLLGLALFVAFIWQARHWPPRDPIPSLPFPTRAAKQRAFDDSEVRRLAMVMPEGDPVPFVVSHMTDEYDRAVGAVGLSIEHGSVGWPYSTDVGRRYTRFVTGAQLHISTATEQQFFDSARQFLEARQPSAEASLAVYLKQPVNSELFTVPGGRARNIAAMTLLVVGCVGGLWFALSSVYEIARIVDNANVRARARALEQTQRCPRCHYDMRGLPEEVCPECGFGYDPWRM